MNMIFLRHWWLTSGLYEANQSTFSSTSITQHIFFIMSAVFISQIFPPIFNDFGGQEIRLSNFLANK